MQTTVQYVIPYCTSPCFFSCYCLFLVLNLFHKIFNDPSGVMTNLDFCAFVLGTVDMCFQIITSFVYYGRESLACNAVYFIFVSPSFSARILFFKFTVKCMHVYLSLYSTKIQDKFGKTTQLDLYLQNLQYAGRNTAISLVSFSLLEL